MTIYTKDYIKDPAALKDYEQDWTDWLGDDTIATSTWIIPTGITKTLDTITPDNLKTIIWLSGGSMRNDYECYNTITTAGGRTDRAMIKIQIR
jgi:hypothetical protein